MISPHNSPLILFSTILATLLIVCFLTHEKRSAQVHNDAQKRKLQRGHQDFLKKNDHSFKINSANNAHFGGNPNAPANTKSTEVLRPFQHKDLKNSLPVQAHLGPIFHNLPDETIQGWYKLDLFNTTDEVAQKRGKVYYSIFSGRKHFMKIHLRYTQILLNMSLIDEVHIWDLCLDDFDNREFLYRFVNATNDARYIIFPNPPEMVWRNGTEMGQGYLWEAYYNHYATHDRYEDEDIVFKADDDCVFLDVSSFDSFLSQITTPNLYFPNIVNNDAGLYVQAKVHAHPAVTSIFNQYELHKVHIEKLVNTYYANDLITAHNYPFSSVSPLTYWGGGLFARGDFADQIHKSFLADPEKFIHNCQNVTHHHHHHNHTKHISHVNHSASSEPSIIPEQTPTTTTGTRIFPVKHRISINMFAGKMAIMKQMYNIFLHYQCCDDEGFVGKWPSLTHLDHMIDSHFVVSHFAFNPQYITSKHFGELVGEYDDLSRRQYLAHFAEDIYDQEVFRSSFPSNAATQEHHETHKEEYAKIVKLKNLVASYGKKYVWTESLRSN